MDLDAIQNQLLQSLGMGGAAFDIEADEIGLAIVLRQRWRRGPVSLQMSLRWPTIVVLKLLLRFVG